jgi:hypothetical protein
MNEDTTRDIEAVQLIQNQLLMYLRGTVSVGMDQTRAILQPKKQQKLLAVTEKLLAVTEKRFRARIRPEIH